MHQGQELLEVRARESEPAGDVAADLPVEARLLDEIAAVSLPQVAGERLDIGDDLHAQHGTPLARRIILGNQKTSGVGRDCASSYVCDEHLKISDAAVPLQAVA